MARRRFLIALTVAGALATSGAAAQTPGYTLPRGYGNICSTAWGWCDLPQRQPINTACVCLTTANQHVAGAARAWLYDAPEHAKSLYLRPHVTPPATVR